MQLMQEAYLQAALRQVVNSKGSDGRHDVDGNEVLSIFEQR